jgi:dTDP-4-dehydrorhamnose reductase
LGFHNAILLRTVFVLSIHCKGIIDPTCSQTLYGATEEILLRNAKYHALNIHSYTEQSWHELMSKSLENVRQLIVKIQMAPYDSYYNQ